MRTPLAGFLLTATASLAIIAAGQASAQSQTESGNLGFELGVYQRAFWNQCREQGYTSLDELGQCVANGQSQTAYLGDPWRNSCANTYRRIRNSAFTLIDLAWYAHVCPTYSPQKPL